MSCHVCMENVRDPLFFLNTLRETRLVTTLELNLDITETPTDVLTESFSFKTLVTYLLI